MKRTLITKVGEFENITSEVSSLEEAIDEYIAIKALFNETDGHNMKEWARVRNDYVNKGEITIEDMEGCNRSQRYFINEIKLVLKNNKE